MKNQNETKNSVDVSLIISEDVRTEVKLKIHETTEEDIKLICTSICSQYDLPRKLEKKLSKQIIKEYTEILNKKKREEQIEQHRQNTFNRLHLDSFARKKLKKEELEIRRKQSVEKVISQCSFSPRINSKSNSMFKRDFNKIEDRLYYGSNLLREKNIFKRLVNSINGRYGAESLYISSHQSDPLFNSNSNESKDVKSLNLNTIEEVENFNATKLKKEEEAEIVIQTPAFYAKEGEMELATNIKETFGTGLITNSNYRSTNQIFASSNNNENKDTLGSNGYYSLNKNTLRKISIKSANNINSNSYTEKYEKILSQKNLQSSPNVQRDTITPSPIKDSQNKNKFFNSQEVLNIEKNNNFNFSGELINYRVDTDKNSENFESGITPISPELDSGRKFKKLNARNEITDQNLLKDSMVKLNNNKSKNDSKFWYERLYNSNQSTKEKKMETIERQIKSQCSFKPHLNKNSKNLISKLRSGENTEALINRLSISKKVKLKDSQFEGIQLSSIAENKEISNRKKTIKKKDNLMKNLNINKITNEDDRGFIEISTLSRSHNFTSELNTQKFTNQNNNEEDIEEKRNELKIREIRRENNLNENLNTIRKNKINTNKIVFQNSINNINKLKFLQIKELYNNLIKHDYKVDCLEGIPKHVVNNIVIPTLSVIEEQNLERNLDNFFYIANEILNNFLN